MTSNQDIPIQISDTHGGFVLTPEGDVDLSRAPSLRSQIAAVFDRKPGKVIMDLGKVPYMDSSGVATLVEAMQIANRSQSTFILTGLQERVRSIFEIARLDKVFTITDTLESAEGM